MFFQFLNLLNIKYLFKVLNKSNIHCKWLSFALLFLLIVNITLITKAFTETSITSVNAQSLPQGKEISNKFTMMRNSESNSLIYESNEINFSMKLPLNWTVFYNSSSLYPILSAYSPEAKNYSVVDILVDNLSLDYNENLTRYLNDTINAYSNSSDYSQFKIVTLSANEHLSNQTAYSFIATYFDTVLGLQSIKEIGTIDDEKMLIIKLTTGSEQFQKHVSTFDSIAHSLQIPQS